MRTVIADQTHIKLMQNVNLVEPIDTILIHRILIIPSDLPFIFKRLQFPLKVAFAMTLNKGRPACT